MANVWQDEMVLMFRVLINDMTSTPTYTDQRLEQILAVAALYVVQDITFDNTYTISIIPVSISPDPVEANDSAFMNFVILRAACIADQGLLRSKALISGLKARCGPAVLETMGHLDGFKELITIGPCAAYDKLKKSYIFGNAELIKAVLSPFVSNDFSPDSLNIGHSRDSYYT